MSRFIYELYMGLKLILSKYGHYDISFRARLFFCVMMTLNFFFLYITFSYLIFGGVNSILTSNKMMFYLFVCIIYLVIYFYLIKIEQLYGCKKDFSDNYSLYKRKGTIWLALTFVIMLPLSSILLWSN